MTDLNGSGVMNNSDDLYSSKRVYDEHEPYTQATPPSSEPLFPMSRSEAAPSWQEITPDSFDLQNDSHAVPDSGLQPQDSQGESDPVLDYASQRYRSQYETGHYAISHYQTDQAKANSIYGAAEVAASDNDLHEQPFKPSNDDMMPAMPPIFTYAPSQGASNDTTSPHGNAKPIQSEKELLFNHNFLVLKDLMQHGAWPQALAKLQAMRLEFPNVAELDNLLAEATLKADLMDQWMHKIQGRRLTVGQEWLIRRSLPFLLLVALFVGGAVFYQTFVAPSRQVVAMERANQALIEEASALVLVGQIEEAIRLYNDVLSRNPSNDTAQQGLVEATRQSLLATTYDLAIRVANKGNLKRSLLLLQSVKAKSPAFRDIDARIERVTSLLDAEEVYVLAEKSFAQRRWIDAIAYYEQTQERAADYQAFRVGQRLIAAYFMAAQKLMTQWPTSEFDTERIRDFVRKAQLQNPQDETIRTFLVQLDDFMKGERSLRNNNVGQAIQNWRVLYDVQPSFLSGYLAEQLYRAYLSMAAETLAADPAAARELYTLAAALPVADSREARNQLQTLGAAIPAAQPTPTTLPTVAYVAPLVAAAPAPTPTPEPTPIPANTYQGWIAFRSTRDGSEQVYIMRGDGGEQQLAPEEIRTRLDGLYQDERRSADGRLAFVRSASGRSDANIYITSADGVNTTTLTDYNGDEYDPVWSSVGDRIAFVSNHTGNDEIWLMRADGAEQRQLTFNNWQWDKHPTWSPDGNQIAFFSNRSGQRQIWVMGSDGSNQRNLSNNVYDDWDPVWIK